MAKVWNGGELLREVRQFLKDNVRGGTTCPACHQSVALRPRTIHAAMARSLAALYNEGGVGTLVHAPTVRKAAGLTSRDDAMLAYWGLMEPGPARREDGGGSGMWAVTKKGGEWVRGEIVIPKTAWVYNLRPWFFCGDQASGKPFEPWSIHDALGKDFDLRDVLSEAG